MNKNLIALAVSTAFALPALADVAVGPLAIYGTAASAFENITISSPTAIVDQSKITQNRLMDQTSKLGFKASPDLGQGLKGLVQMESKLILGNGGNNTQDSAELGSRNTFVGLSSTDYGTVRLGRYDNAYKLNTKLGAKFSYDNVNDASGEFGKDGQIMGRLNDRNADSINYESPKLSGFTILASYNLGKDSDNGLKAGATSGAALAATSTPPATLMPTASAALAYATGPFTVSAAYQNISNAAWELGASSARSAKWNAASGAGFTLTGTTLAGQYTFGEFSLGIVGEVIRSSLSGVSAAANFDQAQTAYHLIGVYKTGPHEAHIRYAQAAEVSGTKGASSIFTGTDGKQFSLMYAYAFNDMVKLVSSFTTVTNGAKASFTSASGFSMTQGATMDQAAIGLTASF